MAGPDNELVVATLHDHLAVEDIPGVVEVIVDVKRRVPTALGRVALAASPASKNG